MNEKSELAQEATAPIVPEMEHEDYSDPKWIPEPPDAGPSKFFFYLGVCMADTLGRV